MIFKPSVLSNFLSFFGPWSSPLTWLALHCECLILWIQHHWSNSHSVSLALFFCKQHRFHNEIWFTRLAFTRFGSLKSLTTTCAFCRVGLFTVANFLSELQTNQTQYNLDSSKYGCLLSHCACCCYHDTSVPTTHCAVSKWNLSSHQPSWNDIFQKA